MMRQLSACAKQTAEIPAKTSNKSNFFNLHKSSIIMETENGDRLLFGSHFSPTVFQRNGTVEYFPSRRGISVHAEITQPFELESISFRSFVQRRFEISGYGLQRIGIQIILERLPLLAETQWITPFTLRPSEERPPLDIGSYVQRSSTTLPSASLITSSHRIK